MTKKDDKLITIIRAQIHNCKAMRREINRLHLSELLEQLSSESLKLFLAHNDATVQEVARSVQKDKLI